MYLRTYNNIEDRNKRDNIVKNNTMSEIEGICFKQRKSMVDVNDPYTIRNDRLVWVQLMMTWMVIHMMNTVGTNESKIFAL